MAGRKRLSARERRETILRAAEGVFAAAGYQATTMDSVAVAAGISKPVLYDHFPSKQMLFNGLLEAISGELLQRGSLGPADDAPAEERIRGALDRFYAVVERRPTAARVLFVLPAQSLETAEIGARIQAAVSAQIANELLTLFQPEEAWRLSATTEFIKQGMHSLAEWWPSHPEVARADLVEQIIVIAWHGLKREAQPGT